MKKYLVLVCVITLMGGCSSAGSINIISPSAPENEVREKVGKAPVTKLQVVSETELQDSHQKPPAQVPPGTSPKTGVAAVPAHTGANSVPSIRSGQALEALINILEKKGTIQREELLQEIRKLDEKDRAR